MHTFISHRSMPKLFSSRNNSKLDWFSYSQRYVYLGLLGLFQVGSIPCVTGRPVRLASLAFILQQIIA